MAFINGGVNEEETDDLMLHYFAKRNGRERFGSWRLGRTSRRAALAPGRDAWPARRAAPAGGAPGVGLTLQGRRGREVTAWLPRRRRVSRRRGSGSQMAERGWPGSWRVAASAPGSGWEARGEREWEGSVQDGGG